MKFLIRCFMHSVWKMYNYKGENNLTTINNHEQYSVWYYDTFVVRDTQWYNYGGEGLNEKGTRTFKKFNILLYNIKTHLWIIKIIPSGRKNMFWLQYEIKLTNYYTFSIVYHDTKIVIWYPLKCLYNFRNILNLFFK